MNECDTQRTEKLQQMQDLQSKRDEKRISRAWIPNLTFAYYLLVKPERRLRTEEATLSKVMSWRRRRREENEITFPFHVPPNIIIIITLICYLEC